MKNNDLTNEQIAGVEPDNRKCRRTGDDRARSHNATKKLFSDLHKTMLDIERFSRDETHGPALEECKTPEDVEVLLRSSKHVVRRRQEGETKDEMRSRIRAESRDLLLTARNPTRRCKFCGKSKVKSRSWVIITPARLCIVLQRVHDGQCALTAYGELRREGTCCLSCWRSRFAGAPRQGDK